MEKRNFKDRIKTSRKVLHEKNNYLKYVVKQILDKAFEEHNRKNATNATLDEQNETEHTTEKRTNISTSLSRKKGRPYYKINEKKLLGICSLNI